MLIMYFVFHNLVGSFVFNFHSDEIQILYLSTDHCITNLNISVLLSLKQTVMQVITF